MLFQKHALFEFRTLSTTRFQVYKNTFQKQFSSFFVRASGEAILGTQRYFSKHFTLDNITVLLSSLNFRAKFLVANHTVILFFLLQ